MTPIQVLSLYFSIVTILLIFYWGKKDKRLILYLVPAGLWIGHDLIFYIFLLLDSLRVFDLHKLDPSLFGKWSAYLRFHGIFTVFYFVFIMSDVLHDAERELKTLWKKIQH